MQADRSGGSSARVLARLPLAAGEARRPVARAEGPSARAYPAGGQRGLCRYARRRRARAVLRALSAPGNRHGDAGRRRDLLDEVAESRAHIGLAYNPPPHPRIEISREFAAAGRAARCEAIIRSRKRKGAGEHRRSARVSARADAADVRHRPCREDAGDGREHHDPPDAHDELARRAEAIRRRRRIS